MQLIHKEARLQNEGSGARAPRSKAFALGLPWRFPTPSVLVWRRLALDTTCAFVCMCMYTFVCVSINKQING